MRVVNISQFEDSVVIHFDTESPRINAYTLASTLVSLADAAKAANNQINPGYDVEILVEALGAGSFRAKIRAFYRSHQNLFSKDIVLALVIGVISNYVYERTLSVGGKVNIQVNTDEVIIQSGDEKIIVPRRVYDATRCAEKNPSFTSAVNRTFDALKRDPDIKGVGFVNNMDDPPPEVMVKREDIGKLVATPTPEPDTRIVAEIVDLQIVKAILERSVRKWEFMWRGVRISAPLMDHQFYEKFFAHHITIAPGDILQSRLAIKQRRDPTTGIYSNESYTVAEVFQHIPRLKQQQLTDLTKEP